MSTGVEKIATLLATEAPFKAWLESQPAEFTAEMSSTQYCLFGQFLNAQKCLRARVTVGMYWGRYGQRELTMPRWTVYFQRECFKYEDVWSKVTRDDSLRALAAVCERVDYLDPWDYAHR